MKKFDLKQFQNRNAVRLNEIAESSKDKFEVIDLSSTGAFPPLYIHADRALKFNIAEGFQVKDVFEVEGWLSQSTEIDTLGLSDYGFKNYSRGSFKLSKVSLEEIFANCEEEVHCLLSRSPNPEKEYEFSRNVTLFGLDDVDKNFCYLILPLGRVNIGELLFYPNGKNPEMPISIDGDMTTKGKKSEVINVALSVLRDAIERNTITSLKDGNSLNQSQLAENIINKAIELYGCDDETKLPRGYSKDNIRTLIRKVLENPIG